ncbi:MAG: hypothetical protein ACFFCS_21790 [Candidatus Hodarchaeota archaeon]
MTVYFAFLLHIYQPPVQIPPVIKKIVHECYLPLVDSLRNHPDAKISLNINGTLTEQLNDYGYTNVIDGFATLASRGQVEFTGSGKFHPLLPLIPEPEVKRQIELNLETNKKFFGDVFKPRGFFPPEMAISEEILKPIKETGHEWVIMSGIANNGEWPVKHIATHETGLNLMFRDDLISIDCAFDRINNVEAFANRLKYRGPYEDYYVILAMDGETFGHHVKHAFNNFLNPLFDALPHRNDIKLCTVSEIIDTFPPGEQQFPKASSWSTMSYDLDRDVPFPLWFEPSNELHVEQYRFIMFALTLIHLTYKYKESMSPDQLGMMNNARNFLDRGVHSCQQWWASKRPWYSPDMILRGLGEIMLAAVNAKRAIPDNAPDIKDAAELIIKDGMLPAHNKIILLL